MNWFALATYQSSSGPRAALVLGEGKSVDLAAAFAATKSPPTWSGQSVQELLMSWPEREADLRQAAQGAGDAVASKRLALLDPGTRLLAPLRPARIFCAASNYIEHANEMGTVLAAKAQSRPYMFLKTATSVIGPHDTVRLPPETKMGDWEVELGVIIGKAVRRVSVERALDHVAGYTVVNDVTARDMNKRTDYPFKFDWFQGKNHDTFCPLGPWVVPASLVADPQKLRLTLKVNAEMMQEATTAEMIWNVREQIAYLSTIVTLQPGDVIATGTPTGVGMGRGVFLKPGDVMTAWVENIGELRNPVAAEAV